MRHRLLALLVVAIASGVTAATIASAGEPRAVAGRIPALPPLAEVANACPLPLSLRPAFEVAARDTGLPLALLVAVGQVESNLQPNARSLADARGVMQVLPSTARELGLDPNRSSTNVLAGARYLRLQLDRFGSPDLALAAYNAGPSAVERAGGAPTLGTLNYVANVRSTWRDLRGCG